MKSNCEKAEDAARKSWAFFYTSEEHRGHRVTSIFRLTKNGQVAVARSFCSPLDEFNQDEGLDKARARMRAFLAILEKKPKMTRYVRKDKYKRNDREFVLFEVVNPTGDPDIERPENDFIKKNVMPKLKLIAKAGGAKKVADKIGAANVCRNAAKAVAAVVAAKEKRKALRK